MKHHFQNKSENPGMMKYYSIPVFFLISIITFTFFPVQSFAANAIKTKKSDIYNSLQQKLIKDGFFIIDIKKIYATPSVKLEDKYISLYFRHSESKLNYNMFLSKRSIKNAQNYLKKYKKNLNQAEKKYGVDKEIIVAIALVETRLGTNTGNTSILNILSSMAALSDRDVRNIMWKKLTKRVKKLDRKRFENWSARKSGWAYKELKAFLKYTRKEKINPASVRGSYAGAMGICQFMPSNALRLAKDGNNDGKINLFNHADAIASIGNYLKRHGWKPGITHKKSLQVILKYNYSKYYARTILKVANRLKGKK